MGADGNPVIWVANAPPNARIQLVRDNRVVVPDVRTASAANAVISIADNLLGPVPAGAHSYVVELVRADNTIQVLGRASVQVPAPEPPAAAPPTTPGAAAFSGEMLRHLSAQLAAMATPPTSAVPAPQAGGVISTPSGQQTAGNQVTLNQFFGHTKFAGPATAATPGHRRLSLFRHSKEVRHQIRTVNIAGLDAEAAAVTNPATATPSTAPTSLKSSTGPKGTSSETPGQSAGSDKIEGTGS
jgi:hypothetical protein